MSTELRLEEHIKAIRENLLEALGKLSLSQLVTFWNEYAKAIKYDEYGVIDTFRNDIDEEDIAYRIDAVFFGQESFCYGVKSYIFINCKEDMYEITTENFDVNEIDDEHILLVERCYDTAKNNN